MNNDKSLAAIGAALLCVVTVTACSTTKAPFARDAHIPAAQNYDVKIQPARISPNPQGAFALSTATGCDVIYVGKATTSDTVTYAVRPTSRIPDSGHCVDRLREQPGVEAITPVS